MTYGLMWTGANDVFGSIRIDLYSFASLLLKLGLVNAINLDGGGSATMVVNNTLVNYPSDEWWVGTLCFGLYCSSILFIVQIISNSKENRVQNETTDDIWIFSSTWVYPKFLIQEN